MTEQPAEEFVPKHEIVTLSDALYQFGHTKHYDDFVKMIEQERLAIQGKPATAKKLEAQRLTG